MTFVECLLNCLHFINPTHCAYIHCICAHSVLHANVPQSTPLMLCMYVLYVRLLQCPLEISSGTLNLQGEYQTMLGQGAILQQQPMFGRVYIGITIVPDDFYTGLSICSTTLSADLLASFVTVEQRGDAEVAGRNITDQSFSRKNITLHVRPGRSGVSLLMPSRWG